MSHTDTKHIPGEGVREFYRRQGEERALEVITAYLTKMEILRDAMFYEGFVAMNNFGTSGVDLNKRLGLNK
jgi:hypothetical protein